MSMTRKPPTKADPIDVSTHFTELPTYVERPMPNKWKLSTQPQSEAEKIRKRIQAGHQSAIDDLADQVAALKKYFKSKGVSSEAAQELDEFLMDVQYIQAHRKSA
jgi:hypothetical protein